MSSAVISCIAAPRLVANYTFFPSVSDPFPEFADHPHSTDLLATCFRCEALPTNNDAGIPGTPVPFRIALGIYCRCTAMSPSAQSQLPYFKQAAFWTSQ